MNNQVKHRLRCGVPRQAGAAFVEFSILGLVFFLLIFGFIETCRYLTIKNWLETAARRGLTTATIPNLSRGFENSNTSPEWQAAAIAVRRRVGEAAVQSGWIGLGSGPASIPVEDIPGETVPVPMMRLLVPTASDLDDTPIVIQVAAQVQVLFPFMPAITISGSASGYRDNAQVGTTPGSAPCAGAAVDSQITCSCGISNTSDPTLCQCPSGYVLSPDGHQCICPNTGAPAPSPCNGPCQISPSDCPLNQFPYTSPDRQTCVCLDCPCGRIRNSPNDFSCNGYVGSGADGEVPVPVCRRGSCLACVNNQFFCGSQVTCQPPYIPSSDHCSCVCPAPNPPCTQSQWFNPATCQCENCSPPTGGCPGTLTFIAAECACGCAPGYTRIGDFCYPPDGGGD